MSSKHHLPKCPTGIRGLDELTRGGLPRNRQTLLSGGPGCGKTLLACEFLYRGAVEHDEPGVMLCFEETGEEIIRNTATFGWDFEKLVEERRLAIDYVYVDRAQLQESGEYDLGGLFARLENDIEAVGARRVVVDTYEALWGGFSNDLILRSEFRRLIRWLNEKGVTSVITGERGPHNLTRRGLEEYVSDCVIALDHRVKEEVSTRRLRVVKYRGSTHGVNEFPFLIDEKGISVMPITSARLDYDVSEETISSGVERLDDMMELGGFYRGGSMLISGTAGTGKTSLAAAFADAACRRGEKVVYTAMEESEKQVIRNMKSIGLDLSQWIDSGLLKFMPVRPTTQGLESHLAGLQRLVDEFEPRLLVVDPVSNLVGIGRPYEVKMMLTRLVDTLKRRGITSVFTDLMENTQFLESTEVGISSIMDIWIGLRNMETGGERNRVLSILKARGQKHSNQMREYLLTEDGISLPDVYVGPAGVLTGSARYSQEAEEHAAQLVRRQTIDSRKRELERRRKAMEARVAALRASFEAEEEELLRELDSMQITEREVAADREEMARRRGDSTADKRGKY